jgi:hypothetical protein
MGRNYIKRPYWLRTVLKITASHFTLKVTKCRVPRSLPQTEEQLFVITAVRSGCESGTIAIVVIGYSLPPSEKRRVWNEVRQVCGKATPILELYSYGTPILPDEAVTAHASQAPDDFVEQVRAILKS